MPTVTAASPSSGPAAGGTSVTLTGTGFVSPGAQFSVSYITFGTARATGVVVASALSLLCVSPAGSGTTSIYVTTPGGTVTFPWTYTGAADALLLETGDTLVTEASDRLVLE
jgi:hypothetical protein